VKTALQFSGGKDSMALLHLVKDFLDHITVYCVRQEAIYPETQATIDWGSSLAPNFIEIVSERPPNSLPSDVVPVRNTQMGHAVEHRQGLEILDRYVCCWYTIMEPLEKRMFADGITRVLRGQKTADRYKGPMMSGTVVAGIEYLFPLERWTDEQVFAYLRENELPIPPYYGELSGGLDCIGCTAWLEEGRLKYLKRAHPEIAENTLKGIRVIAETLRPYVATIEGACDAH